MRRFGDAYLEARSGRFLEVLDAIFGRRFEALPEGNVKRKGFSGGGFWGWGSRWGGCWAAGDAGSRRCLSGFLAGRKLTTRIRVRTTSCGARDGRGSREGAGRRNPGAVARAVPKLCSMKQKSKNGAYRRPWASRSRPLEICRSPGRSLRALMKNFST